MKYSPEDCFILANSEDPVEMPHFVWGFIACKSTHLGVSSIQKVKDQCSGIAYGGGGGGNSKILFLPRFNLNGQCTCP